MLRNVIGIAIIFTTGLGLGLILDGENPASAKITELRHGNYEFINPLLECDLDDGVVFRELKPFRTKLNDLVERQIKTGTASHISVYFRDLNNGPWFGINEKEEFSPASLLKVPFMMAAFKQAELNPEFLTRQVALKANADIHGQEIKPAILMKPGSSYSIEEVIRRMIVYSDNDAKDLLLQNINGSILSRVYNDLEVTAPVIGKTDDFINVKNYASFFRILFNASYLSAEFSEKALRMLSEVGFKDGLVAGVPGNVKVAHKFGEREYLGKKQLHDCGIVYYPNRPYLLCVMNRGSDLNVLTKNIAEISKLVYQEVDKQKR